MSSARSVGLARRTWRCPRTVRYRSTAAVCHEGEADRDSGGRYTQRVSAFEFGHRFDHHATLPFRR